MILSKKLNPPSKKRDHLLSNSLTRLMLLAVTLLVLPFAGTLLVQKPVYADAPFAPEKAITTGAFKATSAYAADMDGDGDIDALSASQADDKIAWYENTSGDGSSRTPHTITTAADGAHSVDAADVDGDGDMDVLSASRWDDKIAWYENTSGDGSAWTPHIITTDADAAHEVHAADVDGDDDIDVLSASWGDHKIAWYENTSVVGPDCTLGLELGYVDGTLTIDFNLGIVEPAIWGVWLFIPDTGVFPFWLIPISDVEPAESFSVPISGFPSIGPVGVITVLNASQGNPCFAFASVDTGPSSAGVSAEELRELLADADGVMPNIGE